MSWTREDKLLLLCCREEIVDKDKNEIIAIQRNDIDWDYFLKKARREGVSPLVFLRLPEIIINRDDIPRPELSDTFIHEQRAGEKTEVRGKNTIPAERYPGPEKLYLRGRYELQILS